MNQESLFDAEKGEQLKDDGMAIAAFNKQADLAHARMVAKILAERDALRITTADEVQEVMTERGVSLGNAAGSIFKGKHWQWTGQWVKSNRVSNHARFIRVWRLVSKMEIA